MILKQKVKESNKINILFGVNLKVKIKRKPINGLKNLDLYSNKDAFGFNKLTINIEKKKKTM